MMVRSVVYLAVATGVVAIALVAALLLGAEERTENEAVVMATEAGGPDAMVWAGPSDNCFIVRHASSDASESAIATVLATAGVAIADSAVRHSFAALQAGLAQAAEGKATITLAGAATSLYDAKRNADGDVSVLPRLQCISVAIAQFGDPECGEDRAFAAAAARSDPAGRFQANEPGCPVAAIMGIREHPHLYVELHVEHHPTAAAFRLVPKVIYRRNSEAGGDSDLMLNVGLFAPAANDNGGGNGTRVATAILDLSAIEVGKDYRDIESLAIESYWTPMPAPPDEAELKRMMASAGATAEVTPVNVVVTIEEREAPSAVARFFASIFADNEATVRATITDIVEKGLSGESATAAE